MKTITLDIDKMLLISSRIVQPGNQYQYGAKITDLDADSSVVRKLRVDCSGYVRYLVRRSAGVKMPDGSVMQHDWVKEQGFTEVSPSTAADDTGERVYIVFLAPDDPRPGHVALVYKGETLESCGGQGPTRRKFKGTRWWRNTSAYILA